MPIFFPTQKDGDLDMARWRVQYQGPDKKTQQTSAEIPDNRKTAQEVKDAIEKG